jgi:hypothetical protein
MREPPEWAIVAGVILVPGVLYMGANHLLGDVASWVSFITIGGGMMTIWVGTQVQERYVQNLLAGIGLAIMVGGIIVTTMME